MAIDGYGNNRRRSGDQCERDEAMVRSRLAVPTEEVKTRFAVIADLDYMGRHIAKEAFASEYLFRKVPTAKGPMAGQPSNQVWALWTHRYYERHDVQTRSNVLYILRLVLEVDDTATRLPSDAEKRSAKEIYEQQAQYLKAVLQAAQTEASEWCLDVVKLWDPSPLVLDLLSRSGIEYDVVEREENSIASLFWYDTDGSAGKDVLPWVNNEHYAWQ